jgi:hypothetical protein
MFGTYERLNVHVMASNMEVIRRAREVLARECWHDPQFREGRKAFYRVMLRHHAAARKLFLDIARGNIH